MMEFIGQAFGVIAAICCALMPLFRKKWQMLAVTLAANALFGLNLVFLDKISSACFIYVVVIIQLLVMFWHLYKDSKVTLAENIIFLILYVACGAIGFKGWLDILPIIGAIFNMLAAFQRDEQKTRILILCNAICWASYFFIDYLIDPPISANILAEIFAIITTTFALIKYGREKKKAE